MLNARITFGNVFAIDENVIGVTSVKKPEGENCEGFNNSPSNIHCTVDEACFEPPCDYQMIG